MAVQLAGQQGPMQGLYPQASACQECGIRAPQPELSSHTEAISSLLMSIECRPLAIHADKLLMSCSL